MPTFWSKLVLRGRNYGMQDEVTKGSSTKKKKKSKKSSSRSNLNSSSDTNFYENDTSDDYMYSARDGSCLSSGTLQYEDIAGILIDNKPPMSDFHNNNNSMAGGMAHYMPKATQHLFLSGLLEGEKIDDYFQDCRLDNALKNFASFENYEQPVIHDQQLVESPPTKENHYETIEPETPPSPEPTMVDNKRSSRYNNNNSHKLDILNWPTSPMSTSGPTTKDKQKRLGRVAMTSGVDSAGEDLDEDDNYIHLGGGGGIPPHSPGASSHSSSANDSFDDTPWCNGVDVLY